MLNTLKIILLKKRVRQTHIAKGTSGKAPTMSLCGKRYKKHAIFSVFYATSKACSCIRCLLSYKKMGLDS